MNARRRIGIDLGGTKIEAAAVSGEAGKIEIERRRRIPTEAEQGYAHILARTAGLIRQTAAEARIEPPFPVGVGMPGSVTHAGLVKNSNTVCLNGRPFRADLAGLLGQEVAFANDANCFALAEAILGAGRGRSLVFGVILGTGVGGGLVVDGRAREGLQSICGEWGHMVLRPDSDRACYCGRHGCVETYLAGPWVARHYQQLGGDACGLPEILARRAAGEERAVRCIDVWLEHYGRALANLINVLDPDAVVLGGGVSRADCLYDEGREQVARYVFTDVLETPILRHELGDSAGVLGAALLVE
ncbi:MAG: ROK family protein [Planctomycetes bacterium]|nr:ROK family protein [Planctomycetota bacterium]